MRNIQTEPNLKNRIIATIFDYGIYLSFWFVYAYTVGSPNAEGGYTVSGLEALPLFAAWFLYFPIVESIRGQTLGHFFAGIQVVGKFGEPIDLLQALKRRILDPVDIFAFFGLVGFLAVKNTDNHQRIGDLFAGTIVVGGETVHCHHCNEKLTLTPADKISGSFTCPSCDTEN